MTNQSTIDKLIEMRLTAMADAFRIQMDDPTMKEVPFEDRFGMLVDVEYSNRKNNRLKRLIRQAEFEQPDASIAAIDYHSGRKLNKALINRLATCEYITEYRNLFITGATGSGKTYMACAFGMEACKHYYSVRYIRLPDLLLDLQAARDNGTFSTVLKKYTKPIVLIIDEWLLLKLTEAEARNLFELIHKRRKKSSTIFCSQFRESEWIQSIYFSHREVFRWVNTFNIDLIGIIRYTIHDGIGKSTFTITDLLVPFTFTELRTKDR